MEGCLTNCVMHERSKQIIMQSMLVKAGQRWSMSANVGRNWSNPAKPGRRWLKPVNTYWSTPVKLVNTGR